MRVFLYTPSPLLGGTETLALRVGLEVRKQGLEARIVCAEGGWLHHNAQTNGLDVVFVPNLGLPENCPSDGDVIIASSKYLDDSALAPFLAQTVFWILHPLEPAWTRFKRVFGMYRWFDSPMCGWLCRVLAPGQHRKLGDLLSRLVQRRALVSMSEDCTEFMSRFFGRSFDLPLIQLPVGATLPPLDGAPVVREALDRVAYFGRIEEFKVTSIRRLIDDYAQSLQSAEKLPLVLFGYGSGESEILSYARERGVEVEITGALPVQQVVERARRERMLVFTMGLSGLDLLLGGIPSVFLPIPTSVRDRRGGYAFLHRLPNGCVGTYPEFLSPDRTLSFGDIRRIATSGSVWEAYEHDLNRIRNDHALPVIVGQLMDIARQRLSARGV